MKPTSRATPVEPTVAPLKHRTRDFFEQLQDHVCAALERIDDRARFKEDLWLHPDGGGGRTRVLENGAVFEKAGVNFSHVSPHLTDPLAAKLGVPAQKALATGVSIVLHPASPMVPTVHMNLRYLELEGGDAWFGGVADLSPCYLFDEDARHFHTLLKEMCDRHGPDFYPRFKKSCDDYFFIKHRNETRGIGGIFFDYERDNPEALFALVKDLGEQFLHSYAPIVERRRNHPWGQREKKWQLIRRGRYTEFNLVYDRGTLFGLETQGRIESILMSLPPEAKWIYDYSPEPDTPEALLADVLRHPRDWT